MDINMLVVYIVSRVCINLSECVTVALPLFKKNVISGSKCEVLIY